MKRQHALVFGMGLVLGSILSAALPHRPLAGLAAPSSLPIPEAVLRLVVDEKPVLVIDVREPRRAAAVRAAISSERVVAESAHGFALRERRLVVSSLEDAGELLGSAGWQDAGLQILRFEPVRHREEPDERARAKAQRLAELMQKPTLTYFEAQQALALGLGNT